MEHREPPRTIVDDRASRPAAHLSSRQLEAPKIEPGRSRRLLIDRTRAAIGVSVVAAGLVGLYFAYRGVQAARAWLDGQPVYQLDFTAIELDPPPPSWFRGGARAFLEDVRRRSRLPERIPFLRLEAKDLEAAFKLDPWTEAVSRTTRRPLGLTIHLTYCQPVAIVKTSEGKQHLVDRRAFILPPEDLDVSLERFAKEQGLIRIEGVGLAPPWNPRAGLPWQSRPGLADITQEKERIRSAAKLADFLRQKRRSLDARKEPTLDFAINPTDGRGLFLWNAESTYILWGPAPGEERKGDLSAEERWEILIDWSRTEKQRVVPIGDYWEITKRGLFHMFQPPAPVSTRNAPPARDDSTFRANASGHRREFLSR